MQPEILTGTPEYFVINKPAGMATEPPSTEPTVRDWLIKSGQIDPGHWGDDERVGIVHRLDTDTSGVLIWAKNTEAQADLRRRWQGRAVKKTYLALVVGRTEASGEIELSLERDNQNNRQRVALLPTAKSRPAITKFKSLAYSEVGDREVSLLELQPITGRTHQIRVHCKAIGHPLVADKLYGEKSSQEIANNVGLKRQFLHAFSIELSGGERYWAPLPADLLDVLEQLAIDQTLYTPSKKM